MRAVIYARYSSDKQSETSIEDQIEVCRRYAAERGWAVTQTYTDAAISGASRFRPTYQKLLHDAGNKKFEIVICEAVDRLDRRLADTADLQDRLSFYGVKLYTPSIGEVTQIHVAVMVMMAQMALKDLGEKTKRGLLGRVLKGKSAGRLAYGYRTPINPDETGEREVNEEEAKVVRRIFWEYAQGASPEAIVKRLNKESVPGPGGRLWSNTTLRGQAECGTGLLNNALYRGVLEWNRCSYVKDPATGKRVARPNPPDKWETHTVPHLRIIEDELWEAAKERQRKIRASLKNTATINQLNATHRSRFLLSGLLRCGCCGGGYTIIGKDRYGCATRRQKGTCENSRTITRQEIEGRVLLGLKERLLAPDLVAAFMAAAQEELTSIRRARQAELAQRNRKLLDAERKIAGIMRAIEDGLYEPSMKERLEILKTERDALQENPDQAAEKDLVILSHPNLPALYRKKVEQLEQVLDGPDRTEAMELIRSMIERVELMPRDTRTGLDAILYGDLATILAACAEAQKANAPGQKASECQLSVVAGAGNHRQLSCWI